MRTATDRLTGALVTLAAAGERPPCGSFGAAELWTSDDADDRKTAAYWCDGCPIITACGEAADENNERWGVWAGVDRSPQHRGRPRKRADHEH
ncbi:WhiB family transcriptional regulator [Microlunatus sp. Y2014]|uniref:WhiB family transcriptional regulator n=1 Tax=Microlunatus sp. Y2014 TaxID=3418488 RepID=UPI003DA6D339